MPKPSPEGFLDGLARALAEPMPRSRALRMLGGAVVTAALPAALRPQRASAQARISTVPTGVCAKNCTDPLPFPCICQGPETAVGVIGCFETCGVAGSTCCCCPQADGSNGCALACPPGTRCGDPNRGEPNCVYECPGDRKCGSKCCEVGSVCADPDLELCCGARETVCRGGNTVSCCKANEHCCSGTCCERGTRCVPGRPGRCTPCPRPPEARRCGNTCCRKGEPCCSGRCCTKQQKCCPSDVCCKKSDKCCGPTCCTDKQKCCDDHCCPEPKTCCGKSCCQAGHTCVARPDLPGGFGCCPDARVVQTPSGKACCDPPYTAREGRCCRPGRACNACDPPCPAEHYCQDGLCVQI
jgi:hypothetical protein